MNNLCNMCPRNCNANRELSSGFCNSKNNIEISKVMLHFFEEPIISGENSLTNKSGGSGAIFFSHCNLKCCYCQNYEISSSGNGKTIDTSTLISIFKQLEDAGANNINLVTPTHYSLQILEALKQYKPKIPVVWNSSGYENPEIINILKNYVDIYLVDLKYYSQENSLKYSKAKDYFEFASKTILQMKKNQPIDIIENGLMQKGIIIRHLVLPNQTSDSLKIIDWINNNLGTSTYFSLMSQYVPMANAKDFPEINRKIKPLEYKVLINKLEKLGFKNCFLQDFESAEKCYTPNFNENENNFKY